MRWIQFATALLLVVAVCPVPTTITDAGGSASSFSVQTISHGLQVRLSLPQAIFPADALVQATLAVKNLSGSRVYLDNWWGTPMVSVIDAQGRAVYSGFFQEIFPSFQPPGIPTGGGPGRFPSLLPGQVFTQQFFLILRAPRVRATIHLARTSFPGSPIVATVTAMLTTRLIAGQGPHIALAKHGSTLEAVIRPSGRTEQGAPYSVAVERCGYTSVHGSLSWTPVIEFRGGAYRIQTICLGPVPEWHVVAAWLNEPVGRLDYVAHK